MGTLVDLVELEQKKGNMFLSFRDYGSVYCNWMHNYSTERLLVKKRKGDERAELMGLIEESPELKPYLESIRTKDYPFRGMEIDAPIEAMSSFVKRVRDERFDEKINDILSEDMQERYSEKRKKYASARKAAESLLEEMDEADYSGILVGKAIEWNKEHYNKKGYSIVNTLITDSQKDMMRWKLGPIGSVIDADERILGILEEKKKIDLEIEKYEEEFGCKIYNKKQNKKGKEKKENIEEKVEELNKRLKQIGNNKAVVEQEIGINKGVVSVYLDSHDYFEYKGVISSEELMDKKWLFVDIEKPKFNTPEEEVSWVSIIMYDKGVGEKHIFTLHDTGKEEVNGCVMNQGYKNEKELVDAVAEFVRKENPHVVSVYNAVYDLVELREAAEKYNGRFSVGARGNIPRKEVNTQFFERMGIPGMIVFDEFKFWSRMYDYLPNRKLVQIGREVLEKESERKSDDSTKEIRKVEKLITYEQQRELEHIAEGRKKVSEGVAALLAKFSGLKVEEVVKKKDLKQIAAQMIATYVSDDTMLLIDLFESEKFKKGLKAVEFVCNFAKIDYATAINSYNGPNKLQDEDFFNVTRTHRKHMFGGGQDKKRKEMNDRTWFLEDRLKRIKMKKEIGVFSPVYQAYIPDWVLLKDVIARRFPEIKDFYEYYQKQEDSQVRFMLARYGDALANYFIIDYAFYIKARNRLQKELEEEVEDPGRKRIFAAKFYKSCFDFLRWIKTADILFEKLEGDEPKSLDEALMAASEKWDNQESLSHNAWMNNLMEIDEHNQIDDSWIRMNRDDIPKIQEHLREANLSRKNIEHVVEQEPEIMKFMQEYNLNLHRFTELINKWASVGNKARNVYGQYLAEPEDVEAELEVGYDWQINEAVKNAGFKVVYKKTNYLYLFGGEEESLKDFKLVVVDKIPTAIVADDPSESQRKRDNFKAKPKIWYKKNGYYSGFKVEEEAGFRYNVYEMRTFGKFLDKFFDEKYAEAFFGLYDSLGLMKDMEQMDTKDLFFRAKSSGRCRGFEANEKKGVCKFYDWNLDFFDEDEDGNKFVLKVLDKKLVPIFLRYDKLKKRPFIMEPFWRKKKDKDGKWRKRVEQEKYYIMGADELVPEKSWYEDYMWTRAECLLDAICSVKEREKSQKIRDASDSEKEELSLKFFENLAKTVNIKTSNADLFRLEQGTLF